MGDSDRKWIYWHRELPPVDAEMVGEHVLEATSSRLRASFAHRDELWPRAYQELMENTQARMIIRSVSAQQRPRRKLHQSR